jgi:hypothetical protein
VSFRTIQILERVQWLTLYAATVGAVAIGILFILTIGAATGIDLLGW